MAKFLRFVLLALLFVATSVIPNYVRIVWTYDENAWINVDPFASTSINVRVGYVYIESPVKFSVYVTYSVTDISGMNPVPVRLTSVTLGNKSISMNPSYPTPVNNKFLFGTLYLGLLFIEPIKIDDFRLTLTFNFSAL